MFQKILIPVDFTPKNDIAIDMAVEFAEQSRGQASLLHVIEKVEHLTPRELNEFYRRLESAALERMAPYAERFRRSGIEIKQEILYGSRAETIVQYAVEKTVDLIVMSSHRVTPDSGWLSVSYKVAILSQCPVILVK